MTGVTQVVRCVAEQVRFGLVALLALLPPATVRAAMALLRLAPADVEVYENPVGAMPQSKYEMYQARG